MDKKQYALVTAFIFLLIGFLHLLRVVNAWEGVIAGWTVPMGLSWGIFIVAFYLSWQGFKLSKKS